MRSCIGAVAVAVLGLAVSGAATLVGDRMTFVPPPEARVEAFLRQLMARRAELALKYLSRDLRARLSPAALQRELDAIEQRIGEIEDVTAQTLSWDRRSAAARAELIASNRARMPLEFRLTWESGAWAIHDLPGALGPGTVSSQKPRDPPANHATHRSAKAFPPPLAEARASFGEARRSAFGAKAARYEIPQPQRPPRARGSTSSP
jgi:hypothetical protein